MRILDSTNGTAVANAIMEPYYLLHLNDAGVKTSIAVFILSSIPLFLFANSGVLVTNSIYAPSYEHAGYLGYLRLYSLDSVITSFLFGIGILPLITYFSKGRNRVLPTALWLLSSSCGLYFATIIGEYFPNARIITGITAGVFISTFMLITVYSYCAKLHFSMKKIGMLAACGVLFALAYISLMGGLELVGNWSTIPIFKMITIIAWQISMGLLLCIASFWKQKINRQI